MQYDVYETENTYTSDLPLDQQIALGINAWAASYRGLTAYGDTKKEAIITLSNYRVAEIRQGASK